MRKIKQWWRSDAADLAALGGVVVMFMATGFTALLKMPVCNVLMWFFLVSVVMAASRCCVKRD